MSFFLVHSNSFIYICTIFQSERNSYIKFDIKMIYLFKVVTLSTFKISSVQGRGSPAYKVKGYQNYIPIYRLIIIN
jgi:hypothetical protein